MQRRYNLAYFILSSVALLILTTLMAGVNAQAQIAFVSGKNNNADIYVMDTDDGIPRKITDNHWLDNDPSWSPDGKRIAFASKRGANWNKRNGDWDIYVMDADGGNIQNLTNNPLAHDRQPAWFRPAFAVAPAGKIFTMWGLLKQAAR